MKNIFTKQFRHFFLILFAVLLILQLLGSGTFIITKTKQLLFTVFITSCLTSMLMYGKEASNRKQEIDRQHYTIPNQRPKDKHCGKI